jgi:hypothetical protein
MLILTYSAIEVKSVSAYPYYDPGHESESRVLTFFCITEALLLILTECNVITPLGITEAVPLILTVCKVITPLGITKALTLILADSVSLFGQSLYFR